MDRNYGYDKNMVTISSFAVISNQMDISIISVLCVYLCVVFLCFHGLTGMPEINAFIHSLVTFLLCSAITTSTTTIVVVVLLLCPNV